MKVTYCDVCGQPSNETIEIEVRNGEHPHNGDTLYCNADVCIPCLKKIPLRCSEEIEDLKDGSYKKR